MVTIKKKRKYLRKRYNKITAFRYFLKRQNKFIYRQNRILKVLKKKLSPTRKKEETEKTINELETPLLIVVKVTANNIFCIFSKFKIKEILILTSSGKLKIKTSKRKLKLSLKLVLKKFTKQIRHSVKKKLVIIRVKSPKRLKKMILRHFINKLKKTKQLLFEIVAKKTFNGCRAKKKRRKKRKGFRVFKC